MLLLRGYQPPFQKCHSQYPLVLLFLVREKLSLFLLQMMKYWNSCSSCVLLQVVLLEVPLQSPLVTLRAAQRDHLK